MSDYLQLFKRGPDNIDTKAQVVAANDAATRQFEIVEPLMSPGINDLLVVAVYPEGIEPFLPFRGIVIDELWVTPEDDTISGRERRDPDSDHGFERVKPDYLLFIFYDQHFYFTRLSDLHDLFGQSTPMIVFKPKPLDSQDTHEEFLRSD